MFNESFLPLQFICLPNGSEKFSTGVGNIATAHIHIKLGFQTTQRKGRSCTKEVH